MHKILFSFFIFLGCTLPRSVSLPKWAYFHPKMSIGGPLGLYYLSSQITQFQNIRVCIQKTHSDYTDPEILLELKLGYLMWFHAALQDESRKALSSLQFLFDTPSSPCKASSEIHILFLDPLVSNDLALAHQNEFSPGKIQCQKTKDSRSQSIQSHCQSMNQKLGLGKAGDYRFIKGNRGSFKLLNSSFAYLSPYARWLPISRQLGISADVALSSSQKNPLDKIGDLLKNVLVFFKVSSEDPQKTLSLMAQKYLTLLGDSKYENLLDFKNLLESESTLGLGDSTLDTLVKQFGSSPQTSLDKAYTPTLAGFHVLLHEIGHQFGMSHSDNPDSMTITGTTSPHSKQNPSGQWVEQESTMAYGKPYLYLTADDKGGIHYLSESLKKAINSLF